MKNISSRPGGTPSKGGGVERPITLWGILDAFRRRWIPALAISIPAALIVAGLLWQAIPAEFESSALIRINQNSGVLVDELKQRETDFLTYRDSQINFIRSRPVIEAALNEDGIMDTQLLRGNPYPVEYLLDDLEVNSDLSAEFIRISLAGEYPEDLQRVVNAVKDVYMDKVVYNEQSEKKANLDKVKKLLAQQEATVTSNQERIKRLAKELGTPGDSKTAAAQLQLKQNNVLMLQQRLGALEQQIRDEEARRKIARDAGLSPDQLPGSQLGFPNATQPQATTNPLLAQRVQYQQALAVVQQKITRFENLVRNKNDPKLVSLRKQKAEIQKGLNALGNGSADSQQVGLSSYELLLKQRVAQTKALQDAEDLLQSTNERIVDLQNEQEQIKHLIEHRDKLREREANMRTELEVPPRVSVIQDANLPQKRNIKSRVQASFLGGFATFFCIVAGFTMFEWFSHRVGSTTDIANAVNLRLVGTIPSPDKGGLLGLGVFAGKVDYDEWNRAVIESMDVVRTYLMRHIDPSRPASLLVTSASANEGKTTVSCQLAASMARAGRRVAIVDCDFRRPSAHLMMDGQEGPGICEYLRGECSMEDIYQTTQAPGLTFIPAGEVDQVVLQQLSTDGGRGLINDLKSRFDFVVIDTSPLLFVAEPSMLAQNADIVLLSTRKDYSRIPYVAQSRDSLRSLQVPLLGAVMVGSDSDFQRQSYGYRQQLQPMARRQSDTPIVNQDTPDQNTVQPAASQDAATQNAAAVAQTTVEQAGQKAGEVIDDYISDSHKPS